MLSLLEPSLFGENNSLFEEVFEDLLQALGLGRAQFENPSSLRSLTKSQLSQEPDRARLEGAAPSCPEHLPGVGGGGVKCFTCQTVRVWDFLGEERKGVFFKSRSPEISCMRILGK